jgi:heat shock protein HslJ
MAVASSWPALAVAVLLAGCTTAPEEGAGMSLVGTEWRLDEFESSDDAIGTIRPQAEEVYTIQLAPDGTAAFQLFCNRGTGRWSSPDADRQSGSLTLQVIATTMAACPPSELERLASDLGRVRTFVIQDGRLHLNLMLDGGNYVWSPQ